MITAERVINRIKKLLNSSDKGSFVVFPGNDSYPSVEVKNGKLTQVDRIIVGKRNLQEINGEFVFKKILQALLEMGLKILKLKDNESSLLFAEVYTDSDKPFVARIFFEHGYQGLGPLTPDRAHFFLGVDHHSEGKIEKEGGKYFYYHYSKKVGELTELKPEDLLV